MGSSDPTPATPPPAAVRSWLDSDTLDRMEKSPSTFSAWALRDAIRSLRAALAAAERERDDAAKVIADLRFNQSHLDAMRERWNELVAERDAARAEVERAFRAGCLAPVGALVASDEVVDRAWARYRQQRAAAEDAKETKPC